MVSRLLGGDFVGGEMVWCLSTSHSSVQFRDCFYFLCFDFAIFFRTGVGGGEERGVS